MANEDGKRFSTRDVNVAKYDRAAKRLAKKRRKREQKHLGKIPGWVYKIILILAVSVVAMLLWFNRQNLAPSNVLEWAQDRVVGMGVGDGYPCKFDGGIQPNNFSCVNKEAVMTSDTALLILNGTAKEIVNRQHSFSNPVMKSSGTRTLIYNLGGTGYQLESYGKTRLKGTAKQNLLGGSLTFNGCYALLTQAEGYCGKLTAYKADGKEKFYYLFSEYCPTSVALNAEGTKAIVTAISAQNGGITSAIYVLDFSTDKAVKPIAVYTENMMLDSYFCENGVAVAVGDRLLTVINTATGSRMNYDYQGMKLTAVTVDNGRAALSLIPYEGASTSSLVLLDQTGKPSVTVKVPGMVHSVSIYGSMVAALANGKLYAYFVADGAVAGSADAGADAKAIALSSERKVYVLGVSEVRCTNIT